ncbi:beta strand repeat-containing protein [Azohydromonas aeria]|uniref:beta strand repeat-containing protein n=1 Tax=Azohydromonas aeria TaxID=2590212 RepID=UPI0012F96E35|nr:VWA domain-containing protein [Azohydromonas aeria]
MAKISYSRAFDIGRQFQLGDWTDAAVTATATAVTLRLGSGVLVLAGSFTLSGTTPVGGTVTGLTYSTFAAGAATATPEFSVTGLSLRYADFQAAVADADLGAVFGAGHDLVVGSAGADRLYGWAGNDRLEGGGGNDTLFGSYGNDTLDGGTGDDSLQGGSGNDSYVVDSAADRVVEVAGGGTDSVRTSLASYTLGAQVENLVFTAIANATGTGNALDNTITGNRGADRLSGLDGNDTLSGGNGNDTLDGGNGNDLLIGDAGASAVTTSASGVSPSNAALPVTVSMTMPEVSTTTSTTVTGYVNNAAFGAEKFNLAFVIDISGSMSSRFTGSSIGDVNGDGTANEKVDAAIASFNALVNSIKAAGLGDMVRIGLIPFSSTAEILAIGTPTSDANGNGVADVIDAAYTLDDAGSTNYGTGLGKAIEFFNGSPSGSNFVFFVSDGQPTDSYAAQLGTLRDKAGINATIRSVGIEAGSGGYLNVLDLLDDGLANGSAIDVKTPGSLTANLLASQVKVADIQQLEIYKNGVLFTTLKPAQLTDTPFGLRYSVTVNGLSTTGADTIETRLVLNDGASSYIATSQQVSVGALVSNDSLVGGAGNDTLDGGAGNDTLAGGLGNDTYHIESAGKTVVELAGQGTDTVEVTFSYSLNSTALANVENLVLLGSNSIDATGNALSNRIEGNLANNVLSGLGGNDTLVGGYGQDIASYAASALAVTVDLSQGSATATGKADQLVGIEGAWGSAFGDLLKGDAGDNVFRGNGGNETIHGGGGLDTVDYSAATAAMTVSLSSSYISGVGYFGTATSANGGEGTDYLNYSDIEGITGSAFGDRITDTTSSGVNNRFDGGAGNDTLDGGAGNDTLIGGLGNDQLIGGAGALDVADYSRSGAAVSVSLVTGRATVGTSNTDNDTISGIEKVIGTGHADSMAGSAANEWFVGGAGNDTLAGGDGNDTLHGGAGTDSLSGGLGDDVYYVDSASDVLVEAAAGGADTVYFDIAAGTVTRSLGEIETAVMAGGALYNITGGAVRNRLTGGAGNDTLNGGTGTEADTLSGGEGIDLLSYAGHASGVKGTLNSTYSDLIDGDATSDFENFLGSDFADTVTGDSGANLMSGAGGNDSLYGGSGEDTLAGGAGNDLLDGGYGTDTVSYAHLAAAISVDLSTGVVTTATEGSDTLVSIERIVGTSGADNIAWVGTKSSSTGQWLDGGAGNDTLVGGYGGDTLVGGAGNDVLNGGNFSYGYADTVDYSGAAGAVSVNLQAGTASGGAGTDQLISIEAAIGSSYADSLTGSSLRADTLTGGGGADTLDGGIDSYADVFVFNQPSDSAASAMDTIRNFVSSGYSVDRLDLSAIDASTTDTSSNSSFQFVGTSAFSGSAGELRYTATATDTYVQADVNGDRVADMSIKLIGVHALTTSNFYL